MQSVGTRLRDARIKKGYTLEEIHARTRISLKNLNAIESDDLSKISSPFTYRSFVKQIADMVGLDHETLSPDAHTASSTMPEPLVPGQEEEVAARPHQFPQPKPKRKTTWIYRTASIAAIAGAISGYLVFRNGGIEAAKLPASVLPASNTQSALRKEQAAAASAPVAATPKPAVLPAHRQVSLPPPGKEQLVPAARVSNRGSHEIAPVPLRTTSQPSAPPMTPRAQVTAPDVDAAPIHIELSANEPTWLSIVADGKTAYAGILDPLHTKILNGRETARIRTGNAGGVNIIFNGRALGAMGRRGQSRTFVFTKGGYEVVQGA